MELLAIAIAPGLAICLFIFHRDAYNREPKLNLFVSFFLGALAIVPAVFIELFFDSFTDNSITGIALKTFLVVALTEELVKFVVLRFYAYRRKSFDEPLDGIVYGVMVSMGFATLENILYVQKYGMQVGWMRMFLAVPAHACFGVIMGYFVGKAKFNVNNTGLLLKGLFWAVFFHGAYDFFLFINQSPEISDDAAKGLLFLGAIVSLIVALRLSLKHIRIHRKLSQQTFHPTEKLRLQKASVNDISLIRKMADVVWPATYRSILSPEQVEYMMAKMYSADALEKQMRDGHEFVLVYDEQEPVGFASFSKLEPGIYKLQKIYVLPSQQGRGTGRFVIERLTALMLSHGATALRLNVNRNNKAKDFYEKLGFVVLQEEDIDIGNGYWMNDYVLEKKLS